MLPGARVQRRQAGRAGSSQVELSQPGRRPGESTLTQRCNAGNPPAKRRVLIRHASVLPHTVCRASLARPRHARSRVMSRQVSSCYVVLCYVMSSQLSQVNPCRIMASNAVVFKNTGFVWWDVGHAMRHAATRPAGMLHHTHMPTHIVQCAGHSHTRTAACPRGRRRHARASLRACERAPSTRQQQQQVGRLGSFSNLQL